MKGSCEPGCLCDCCTGIDRRTPRPIASPPGRSRLRYRVGEYGAFLQSMLADLSHEPKPPGPAGSSQALSGGAFSGERTVNDVGSGGPLADLRTRALDDPSIGFLDAWALVLHVLTFYTERTVNEGFLRTATELRSLFELARLIGYEPRPGVSAATFLAYTLDKDQTVEIPRGSRAQSVPDAGALPQTFETSRDLLASDRWNDLKPRRARPHRFGIGQTTAGRRVWFDGLNTQLKPNDPLLLVFDAAVGEPFRVQNVHTENAEQRTRVVLQEFTSAAFAGGPVQALSVAFKQFQSARGLLLADVGYLRLSDEARAAFEAALSPAAAALANAATTIPQALTAVQSVVAAMTTAAAGTFEFPEVAPANERPILEASLRETLETILQKLDDLQYFLILQNVKGETDQTILNDLSTVASTLPEPIPTEFQRVSDKWSTVQILSPANLANLHEETLRMLALFPDSQATLVTPIVQRVTLVQGIVVQNVLRRIVLRLSDASQSGIESDTRICLRSRAILEALLTQLVTVDSERLSSALTDVRRRLEASLAGLAPRVVFDQITSLISAVREQLAKIDSESPANVAAQLKTKCEGFEDLRDLWDAAKASLQALQDNTDDAADSLKTLRTSLLQDANALGLSQLNTFTVVPHANQPLPIMGDPAESRADRHAAFCEAWKLVCFDAAGFDHVVSATEPFGSKVVALRQACEAAAPSTDELKTACEDLIALCQPKLDLPIDVCDSVPDVAFTAPNGLLIDTAAQLKLLVDLHQRLLEAINALTLSDDAVLKAIAEVLVSAADARAALESGRDFLRHIRDAINALHAEGSEDEERFRYPASELAAFRDRINELLPTLDSRFVRLSNAASQLAVLSSPPTGGGSGLVDRPELTVHLSLWNHVEAAFFAILAENEDLLAATGLSLTAASALGRLGALMPFLRREERLAAEGEFPRLGPWLEVAVESLDRFASDLLIEPDELDADALAELERLIDVDQGSRLIGALRNVSHAASDRESNYSRRLEIDDSDSGAGSLNSQRINDLALRLVGEFEPRLAGVVYSAIENSKLPRTGRFQAVHVLRAKAHPFGHGSSRKTSTETTGTDPTTTKLIVGEERKLIPTDDAATPTTFMPHHTANLLLLDGVNDKITPGSFVIIERTTPPADLDIENPLVARVDAVATVSAQGYGLPSMQVTQLTLDRPWLSALDLEVVGGGDHGLLSRIRSTVVYTQSEPLPLAGEPYDADVGPIAMDDPSAATIELDKVVSHLRQGQWIVVAGERTDVPGTTGIRGAEPAMIAGVSQLSDAPNSGGQGRPHTLLRLAKPLTSSYQRETVTVYGNVVHATHGETKAEVLGSGDPRRQHQTVSLKQRPLTHLAAPTPSGAASTLDVRVSGVRWHQAEHGAELGPNDLGYRVWIDADDVVTITFDGAPPPYGHENLRATYRVGTGRAGNQDAGKISQLLSRPLGVKEVINPLPATGGVDRESTADIRKNAPIGVTALDRLVSVADYADFARGFAGVSKAFATRLSDGRVQRVHLTVSGPQGAEIPIGSDLYRNLVLAIRSHGNELEPFTVQNRLARIIIIVARLKTDPDYETNDVQANVRRRLTERFGFDGRDFGQDVILSEILSVMQRTPGVSSVAIDALGTVDERNAEGTYTPLRAIVEVIREIAKSEPPVRIAVARTRRQADVLRPAEIAYISERLEETIILNPWNGEEERS